MGGMRPAETMVSLTGTQSHRTKSRLKLLVFPAGKKSLKQKDYKSS